MMVAFRTASARELQIVRLDVEVPAGNKDGRVELT